MSFNPNPLPPESVLLGKGPLSGAVTNGFGHFTIYLPGLWRTPKHADEKGRWYDKSSGGDPGFEYAVEPGTVAWTHFGDFYPQLLQSLTVTHHEF